MEPVGDKLHLEPISQPANITIVCTAPLDRLNPKQRQKILNSDRWLHEVTDKRRVYQFEDYIGAMNFFGCLQKLGIPAFIVRYR